MTVQQSAKDFKIRGSNTDGTTDEFLTVKKDGGFEIYSKGQLAAKSKGVDINSTDGDIDIHTQLVSGRGAAININSAGSINIDSANSMNMHSIESVSIEGGSNARIESPRRAELSAGTYGSYNQMRVYADGDGYMCLGNGDASGGYGFDIYTEESTESGRYTESGNGTGVNCADGAFVPGIYINAGNNADSYGKGTAQWYVRANPLHVMFERWEAAARDYEARIAALETRLGALERAV